MIKNYVTIIGIVTMLVPSITKAQTDPDLSLPEIKISEMQEIEPGTTSVKMATGNNYYIKRIAVDTVPDFSVENVIITEVVPERDVFKLKYDAILKNHGTKTYQLGDGVVQNYMNTDSVLNGGTRIGAGGRIFSGRNLVIGPLQTTTYSFYTYTDTLKIRSFPYLIVTFTPHPDTIDVNEDNNYYILRLDPAILTSPPSTYTVTFNDWDSSAISSVIVEHGSTATAPTAPTRTGYTFTGWDVSFKNVTSNLTVTAQYILTSPPQSSGISVNNLDEMNFLWNSANNTFMFSNLEGQAAYSVFDLNGRLVQTGDASNNKYVPIQQGPGIYIIRVVNKGHFYMEKIYIQ